ncbi:hypothetical protein B0H13DRAFT_1852123 [Mycena leptocephala]|nr:hypothetical protein B0H13DRAFT_1852123 [Mycena leptocephala]
MCPIIRVENELSPAYQATAECRREFSCCRNATKRAADSVKMDLNRPAGLAKDEPWYTKKTADLNSGRKLNTPSFYRPQGTGAENTVSGSDRLLVIDVATRQEVTLSDFPSGQSVSDSLSDDAWEHVDPLEEEEEWDNCIVSTQDNLDKPSKDAPEILKRPTYASVLAGPHSQTITTV